VADEPRTPRGWLSLYTLAFVLMSIAATILVMATLGRLESLRLLRVSSGFSVAAIVVAVVAVLVPRRR
jgi:hypothetical protein